MEAHSSTAAVKCKRLQGTLHEKPRWMVLRNTEARFRISLKSKGGVPSLKNRALQNLDQVQSMFISKGA